MESKILSLPLNHSTNLARDAGWSRELFVKPPFKNVTVFFFVPSSDLEELLPPLEEVPALLLLVPVLLLEVPVLFDVLVVSLDESLVVSTLLEELLESSSRLEDGSLLALEEQATNVIAANKTNRFFIFIINYLANA